MEETSTVDRDVSLAIASDDPRRAICNLSAMTDKSLIVRDDRGFRGVCQLWGLLGEQSPTFSDRGLGQNSASHGSSLRGVRTVTKTG